MYNACGAHNLKLVVQSCSRGVFVATAHTKHRTSQLARRNLQPSHYSLPEAEVRFAHAQIPYRSTQPRTIRLPFVAEYRKAIQCIVVSRFGLFYLNFCGSGVSFFLPGSGFVHLYERPHSLPAENWSITHAPYLTLAHLSY